MPELPLASTGPQASTGARAPFRHLAPVIVVAGGFLLATLVWAVAGTRLPGGRWFAVHLFTVGVITNLVTAMTFHFSRTLLHSRGDDSRQARLVVLNAGAVSLLVGRAGGWLPLVAVGGSVLIAAVVWLYVDLRRQRKAALAARFAYVVRAYERACSQFFHGALLGILLGTGVLSGTWYGAGRLAHMHVNVLGWAGVTLLATVVFFGPTMMRARVQSGADEAARGALRGGTTGLSVAALALLAGGWQGGPQLLLRLLAAAGLLVYAVAAARVCLPVLRAGVKAVPSAHTWLIQAACVWFVFAAAADAVVVASGRVELLDAVGVVLLAGVLAQAILAALSFLGPMALVAGTAARNAARGTLDVGARARATALNVGVVALAAAAVAGPVGAWLPALGWGAVGAAVVVQLLLLARVGLRRA